MGNMTIDEAWRIIMAASVRKPARFHDTPSSEVASETIELSESLEIFLKVVESLDLLEALAVVLEVEFLANVRHQLAEVAVD